MPLIYIRTAKHVIDIWYFICTFFYFYLFEEFLCDVSGSGIDGHFELGDFFIDLLHEMNDKVDQFDSRHSLRVKIRYQKTNIIVLKKWRMNEKKKTICKTEFILRRDFSFAVFQSVQPVAS